MKPSNNISKVFSPPIVETADYVKKFSSKNKTLISFGQGLPFFNPPNFILKELAELMSNSGLIHKYTNDEGLRELRELLLEKHSSNYSSLTHNNLLVTAGANQAFFIMLQSIINLGDEVIVFSPYYFNHVMTIQALHAKPVFVKRTSSFEIDVSALKKAITGKTKVIVLTSPDNPTGSVFNRPLLQQILVISKENNIYIIHDETYRDFIFDPSNNPHYSLLDEEKNSLDNVISIHSFSKNYGMSGYRLGYVFFPSNLYEGAIKIQDTLIVSPPAVSQYLGKIILENSDRVKIWFTEQFTEISKIRTLILNELKSNDFFQISDQSLTGLGGYYLFPKLTHPKIKNAKDFSQRLIREKNIIVLPGNYFGQGWENHIRISFGNVTMRDAIEGFKRINSLGI